MHPRPLLNTSKARQTKPQTLTVSTAAAQHFCSRLFGWCCCGRLLLAITGLLRGLQERA